MRSTVALMKAKVTHAVLMRRRPRQVHLPQFEIRGGARTALSSRIRSRACCAALRKGQRARKLITGAR